MIVTLLTSCRPLMVFFTFVLVELLCTADESSWRWQDSGRILPSAGQRQYALGLAGLAGVLLCLGL